MPMSRSRWTAVGRQAVVQSLFFGKKGLGLLKTVASVGSYPNSTLCPSNITVQAETDVQVNRAWV